MHIMECYPGFLVAVHHKKLTENQEHDPLIMQRGFFSFVAWKKLHTHLAATPAASIAPRGVQ